MSHSLSITVLVVQFVCFTYVLLAEFNEFCKAFSIVPITGELLFNLVSMLSRILIEVFLVAWALALVFNIRNLKGPTPAPSELASCPPAARAPRSLLPVFFRQALSLFWRRLAPWTLSSQLLGSPREKDAPLVGAVTASDGAGCDQNIRLIFNSAVRFGGGRKSSSCLVSLLPCPPSWCSYHYPLTAGLLVGLGGHPRWNSRSLGKGGRTIQIVDVGLGKRGRVHACPALAPPPKLAKSEDGARLPWAVQRV